MKLSVNVLHIVRLVALTAVADSSVIPKFSQRLFLPCDTSQFIDVLEKIERVTALECQPIFKDQRSPEKLRTPVL
ncbi:DNA-directed RNA polymerase II subunit RPB2 [Fusarium oxysporum f. sp. albedinis]|nr:DNA-directed RNA polymerase II subunit RPB2 [Fusarium oxysporum f. sp. albedinis]